MKIRIGIAILLSSLLAGIASAAQPNLGAPVAPPLHSEERGQALARQLRHAAPEGDVHFFAILKTRLDDGSIRRVPVECRVDRIEDGWRQTYRTTATNGLPAQRLAITHRDDQPNLYEFIEGDPPDPARVRTPGKAQPLGGSEFWVADLGMEFLHWPFQKLIKVEMRKGRVCHVLESLNPAGEGYSRVVCWLDKEEGQPLLAEAFDGDDRMVKEFAIGSMKKVDGQWQVKDMKIENLQTGAKTWLEFEFE